MVATINFFPVFDHPLDGKHVILADGIEKFGCCLNVGGFAPFAFVDRIKAAGNTLSSRIFLDEPAGFVSKFPTSLTSYKTLYARDSAANIRLVFFVLQFLLLFVLGFRTKL